MAKCPSDRQCPAHLHSSRKGLRAHHYFPAAWWFRQSMFLTKHTALHLILLAQGMPRMMEPVVFTMWFKSQRQIASTFKTTWIMCLREVQKFGTVFPEVGFVSNLLSASRKRLKSLTHPLGEEEPPPQFPLLSDSFSMLQHNKPGSPQHAHPDLLTSQQQ